MLGSLVEFDWLFPINRNRRIRHCLFHCLIEIRLLSCMSFRLMNPVHCSIVCHPDPRRDRVSRDVLYFSTKSGSSRMSWQTSSCVIEREIRRSRQTCCNTRSMFEAFMWLRTSRANLLRSIKNHLFHDFFTLLVDVVLGSFRRASRTRDLL